jgi:HlyD family secretion protein
VKKKIIFWTVLLLLIAGGGLSYVYYFMDRKPAAHYRTARVERGSLSTYVTANGTVNPVITVLVGSQVSGTILKLYADYNTQVKQDQLIAQIDPALFQAQVSQAKGQLENTKAALLTSQADVATARANVEARKANVLKAKVSVQDTKRTLNRNLELFTRNLIAASDRDTAQANFDSAVALQEAAEAQLNASGAQLESAKAKVEAARASIKQSEASLELAQVNLDHTRIKAPVTGIVISRNVDVGQTVAASLQAPTIFTIAQDLTKMQVDTNVSEADVGRVAVGQEAAFTVDAFPQITFRGRVTEIRNAPVTVQNVVTYNVVIQVHNPDLKLRPGMTANASVLVAQKDDVLKIPNSALRFRPDFAKKEAVSKRPQATKPVVAVPPRTGELTAEKLRSLNLTPEQRAAIARIVKELKERKDGAAAEGRKAGAKGGASAAGRKPGFEVASAKPSAPSREGFNSKIRALLTEEQKKKFDQLFQGSMSAQTTVQVFRVWVPVPGDKPVQVEITAGISDGTFTEVASGDLKEGQEVITEAATGNSNGNRPATQAPTMKGFR